MKKDGKNHVLSLFSGIGGFDLAYELAFAPGGNFYYSEIDKYALEIYQKRFPNAVPLGDVTKINVASLPEFDIIMGGSPCQDLSIAKKDRQGLDGSRSGLFWKFVEIIKSKRPEYFILENVNSMPKEAKAIISKALYGIEPVMINAATVSAQNRKRLFWVGERVKSLTDEPEYRKVEIAQPADRGLYLKHILQAASEVDEAFFVSYDPDANEYFHDDSERKSRTVRSSGRSSGLGDKHNWDTIRIGSFNSGGQGDRIYSPDGKSVSLSANGGGRGAKTGLYAIKQNVRRLTPIECERLQGFPDNWTEGISNSQRYKCLGNAVNVQVAKHILDAIIKLKGGS